MFSSFSSVLPSLSNFGFGSRKKPIDVSEVPTYDTESKDDSRSRRLNSLIKLNHANHSIIYNHLQFHNHTPHILASAYILGASADHLTKIYEAEAKNLEPWHDSPGEISKDDWRDFLGKREYQRAFLDFFEDQLVSFGYDWKKLLEHYLYKGKEPLINSLVSGLGHPLIHLGYAYEISSRHVASEALAMGCCFYDDLHKYIDDPAYTRPGPYKSTSVLEILKRVRDDSRLDGQLDHIGADNIALLLAKFENVVLDHWNAWDINASNARTCFEQAQKAAVALVVATPNHPPQKSRNDGKGNGKKRYDFFLLHSLTTSHALRILLPIIPADHHVTLARSWCLFALLAYMGQMRPEIDLDMIDSFPIDDTIKERPWDHVKDRALNSSHFADPHFVKGLRAMMVAEDTWGIDESYWRKAAVRMTDEFDQWGGFDEKTTGYQPH